MRAELSAGEALVGLLEDWGVKTIFGIPGVHNVEMYAMNRVRASWPMAMRAQRAHPVCALPSPGRGF